jgi:cellulose biosynthesis protein BcsQ
MFITVVNQKGGVGKTTLAVHLAVWLHEHGTRVALIDADGQAASTRWTQAAESRITVVTQADADAIIETAQQLRESHDVVIGDGPANLAEATRALLLVADLAVVPCGASLPELEAATQSIRILRSAQMVRSAALPAGRLVLNRLRSPGIATRRLHVGDTGVLLHAALARSRRGFARAAQRCLADGPPGARRRPGNDLFTGGALHLWRSLAARSVKR